MIRALVILLLLLCLACMGTAMLTLLTEGARTAVGGWFAASACSGLLGLILDELCE
jgi:hypothetical protein